MLYDRLGFIRIIVIAGLILLYWGLGFYFHSVLGTGIIYSHFAYIPIVISGMWWGKKGIVVAVILGFLTFSFYFSEYVSVLSDVIRTFNFVVVALCVGLISEREKKEHHALELSEQKYSQIIDKSLTGIFLYADETLIFANSQFCSLLGYTFGEINGKSIWELIYPDDVALVRELTDRRVKGEEDDLHYECRYRTRSDEVKWFDVASSGAVFDGRDVILVNVYDITERRLMQEEKARIDEIMQNQEEQLVHSTRLAELGEMAASIAHELNQPLTGIKNFARNAYYMIEQSAGSQEEISDNLKMISEQVDRASRIINQMRDLTRKSQRNIAPVDIREILSGCLEFLSSQFSLAGIAVQLDLEENVPHISGDRLRLEQVFLNILTNAKQAMNDSGEKTLTVRTYTEQQTGNAVAEIADTGKGFLPGDREKLFVPFYTTKEVGTGTGLGLSISLSIIKDHNGSLEAEPLPGTGALFRISLPAFSEHTSKENSHDA